MTKRGQKFGKVLFVSMLLTLTIALGGSQAIRRRKALHRLQRHRQQKQAARLRQLRLPMEKHRRLQLVFHRI